MNEYYKELTQEEQESLSEVIQLLYRQTFLLERKYEKRSGRFQYRKEYRVCSKHMEFLKEYFAVAGITLKENVHMGGRDAVGRKASKACYHLSADIKAYL